VDVNWLVVVSWSSWGQVNRYCAAVFLLSASVQGYREWSSLQTDSPRMFTAEDVAPVLESLTAPFLCGQASEWDCEEWKACVRSTQRREESRSRSERARGACVCRRAQYHFPQSRLRGHLAGN